MIAFEELNDDGSNTVFHASNTVGKSLHDQNIHTQTVGLRAPDLDTIMHGVAEAGSVRASQGLRRENAAYMVTPLLAVDAWLRLNM